MISRWMVVTATSVIVIVLTCSLIAGDYYFGLWASQMLFGNSSGLIPGMFAGIVIPLLLICIGAFIYLLFTLVRASVYDIYDAINRLNQMKR